MEGVYFHTYSSGTVEILCTPGMTSHHTWQEIMQYFEQQGKPVGTKAEPVIVTGKPRVHGESAESTSGSNMGDALAHVGGNRGDDSDGGGGGAGDVSGTGTIGMTLQSGRMVSYCKPTVVEDLHLEDHLVGEGWSGCIVRGTYNGRPVAVKLAIVGSDVAKALVNEVAAYQRLVKYWGRYVPVLVSHGITAFGHVQYVATELIKGFELGIEALTKEVATASFAALDAMHSSGILHGDIRHANILVPKGGRDGVRFIDFGFSQPILDSKYCKMERAQLQDIIDKLSGRSLSAPRIAT